MGNGMQHGRFNRVMMRTWLDQAGRKKRRALNRKKKAARLAPRPAAGLLRPVVHPPTQRYNMKLRLGKSFTLDELREAKIPQKLARTIGIAVDHRRRNRCAESLQANVERLKLYKSKLLIFPKKSGKKGVKAGDTPKSELQNVAQNTQGDNSYSEVGPNSGEPRHHGRREKGDVLSLQDLEEGKDQLEVPRIQD